MLNFSVPIINETLVEIIIWSEDGHNAHFWPSYINSKPKPVHEAYYQHTCHFYYIITMNDHLWYKPYMQTWFSWPSPCIQNL